MPQSFSFGFDSDGTEENGIERVAVEVEVEVEVGPSHHNPENKPVAITEPELHKLQDLVGMLLFALSFSSSLSHTLWQTCCLFLLPLTSHKCSEYGFT